MSKDMRSLSPTTFRKAMLPVFVAAAMLLAMTAVFQTTQAAPPELSLADILIALRSKKASLTEKNQILTSAVAERGITFVLTPEIEKELQGTGADATLIQAIRTKSQPAVAAVPEKRPEPVAAPAPTPIPLDANFYRNRAAGYAAKGEFDRAVVDLDQVIAMKGDDASTYLSRGLAYSARNRPDLAINDFNKAIELDAKHSSAYFNRGLFYEKSGETEKAIGDYEKVVSLDASNEPAKQNLQKLKTSLVKPEPPKTVSAPPVQVVASAPDPAGPAMVNLGQINNAIRLAVPVYPAMARQMNVQGRVIVQVNLDEEGDIISVKATSGPTTLRAASEEAARRSKFNPAKVGDRPAKSTGFVVFNFVS